MHYNSKIKELELQYERLTASIKTSSSTENSEAIYKKLTLISEELTKYRRMQYESQFIMEEDYDY